MKYTKYQVGSVLYKRNHKGQYYAGISKTKASALGLVLAVVGIGMCYSLVHARGLVTVPRVETVQVESVTASTQENTTGDCVKVNNVHDCTDADTRLKIYDLTQGGTKAIKWYKSQKLILQQVCQNNGFTGNECPKTLYGMAMQESYFGKAMTGDNGQSHGWFHIMEYHNVPTTCSHDLKCSADWTLKRMIRKGYATNPSLAIMLHNGTPNTKATLNYLAQVTKKSAGYDKLY